MGILSAHTEVIALLQLSSHLLRRQSAPKRREQPQALHCRASASLLMIPAHTEHPQPSPALTLAALQSRASQKIRVRFPASLESPSSAFLPPGSGILRVPGRTGERSPSTSEAERGTENVPKRGGKCWSSLLGFIPHGKKTWPRRSQLPSAAGKLSHAAADTAGGDNAGSNLSFWMRAMFQIPERFYPDQLGKLTPAGRADPAVTPFPAHLGARDGCRLVLPRQGRGQNEGSPPKT